MTDYGLSRDRYHRYTAYYPGMDAPVGPLVGVTSVLKIQDTLIGGDLATWGGKLAAEYVIDRWRAGEPADIEELRTGALATVTQARDVGTAVHARIEHILLGDSPGPQCAVHPPEFGRMGACQLLPDLVPPYIYAFSSFLAAKRPEVLMAEAMVVNLAHRFAGTFDFAALIDGRRAMVDVKSGKLKNSHRLQLAAYSAGEFIGRPGDPVQYPMPKIQDHYVLLLTPEGYDLVPLHVTASDRRHFLSLVKTYRSLREWEKAA